ncbi:uroporphyrinogen decarboxylase [Selenomonas ruminantium]|uniref:Uroporphyrinogen decarboxylase n=1 Tax=Selenomonas ruminantium TaxID=971 RepID=A0A1I3GH05_SELRU|nr:uroporphyrinogen decarboxylase family protein [Selenomonas ruminantium]SFI22421.1 uroporphyrinogen decarboxylase [Selenomonas ruminantium]
MTINRKQLVLDALDGKDVERIPSGFWFHFLDDEIGSDAFAHPELSQKVLAKQIEYIDSFRPDYVKIMTDGFFHYNHPQVAAAQRVEDLKDLQPLAEDDPWFTRQIEYARQLVQRYGDEIALFYNVFGANTTFRFMQSHWEKGEEKLVSFIREDKETVREAFDVISSDLAKLAKRLITEAHVTGIYFSVQNLLGDGITREIYEDVLAPGEKKILAAANSVSDYNILHVCGYAGHHNRLEWYEDYEVKAVNWAVSVEHVSLEEGQQIFDGRTVIGGFGNLTSDVLYSGSKEEIQQETRRLIAKAGRRGVILGADCTVPRDIDWQHLEWVREAAV